MSMELQVNYLKFDHHLNFNSKNKYHDKRNSINDNYLQKESNRLEILSRTNYLHNIQLFIANI